MSYRRLVSTKRQPVARLEPQRFTRSVVAPTRNVVPVLPNLPTPSVPAFPSLPNAPMPAPFRPGNPSSSLGRHSRPPRAWEDLVKDIERIREGALDEAPPLQDGDDPIDDPSEGGATCTVRFAGGIVTKSCPDDPESLRLEYELTERAREILGENGVVRMSYEEREGLQIERLYAGVLFAKRKGVRTFFEGEGDSPKFGKIRRVTDAARAQLRADVIKLHANGFAHGDIHAGNIGVKSVNTDGEATELVLIDFSEAVDLQRLRALGVPEDARKLGRQIARGTDDWNTSYVKRLMKAGLATPEELLETAVDYDLLQLDNLGI